jgi:hypothetical protein
MSPSIPRRGPSQGETIDEAMVNLKEAVELYLEEFPLKNVGTSWMTTFEVTGAEASAN